MMSDQAKWLNLLVGLIVEWHHDRNLIEGSTHEAQLKKLDEEVGELKASIAAGEDLRDDIGDIIVVLINLITREKLELVDAIEVAYLDIKDRKGTMVNGIFVKENDTAQLELDL